MAQRARECRARVSAVRWLARHVVEADLAMEEPPTLVFQAGQWVSVPFGPKIVRAYSIASTPQSPSRITLCADVAPGGLGSDWFRGLKPGDGVRFKGPLGGFVYSRADARHPLFVAEEIGIVPIRSILRELYDTGFGRPASLVYGVPDERARVYDTELRSLQRRYPGFSYHPVVGQALDAVVERLTPSVQGLVAYVCGGGESIDRVRAVLVGKGLDRKAVKWEKFW